MTNVVALRNNSLADLAHEINVRLQKSEDHRLSACVKLAEAQVACKELGIPFRRWVAENIVFVGYVEATRLAKIGRADDPAQALEDHRSKGQARKAKHDAKVALRNATPSAGPTPPATSKAAQTEQATRAIIQLSSLSEPSYLIDAMSAADSAPRVDETVANALAWLTEFADLWAAKRREHNDA